MSKPSAAEQYMLELVNRMRQNPQNELDLLLSNADSEVGQALEYFKVDRQILSEQWRKLEPVAPVAWSEQLHDSAETHNELMVYYDRQAHNLPNELGLLERVEKTGYQVAKVAENIFAYPESVFAGHAGFAIDWGDTETGIQDPAGHRITLVNGDYREVGISIVEENDPDTKVGSLLITQHFGIDRAAAWSGDDLWLLGVVYDDRVYNDDFYTPGEGWGNVIVEAQSDETDKIYTTQTWGSGGYQLKLPSGTYTITFRGDFDRDGVTDAVVQRTTIDNGNIKLDLALDSPWEMLREQLDLTTPVTESEEDPEPSIENAPPRDSRTQIADSTGSVTFDVTFDNTEVTVSLAPFPGGEVTGDWLKGSAAADTLLGSETDDALRGGDGRDLLVGLQDVDRLEGDDGDDLLFGNVGQDTLDGGKNNDKLYAGQDDDLAIGGDGRDAIMGDWGSDTMTGDEGNDLLYGNAGNDLIDGGLDNDTLMGGRDDDTLIGGSGDDVLCGDLGTDLLIGGSGRDRFEVKPDSGAVVIADFTNGIDRIALKDGLRFEEFASVQLGNDLQLMTGSLSITLQNIDRSQIDATDFLNR